MRFKPGTEPYRRYDGPRCTSRPNSPAGQSSAPGCYPWWQGAAFVREGHGTGRRTVTRRQGSPRGPGSTRCHARAPFCNFGGVGDSGLSANRATGRHFRRVSATKERAPIVGAAVLPDQSYQVDACSIHDTTRSCSQPRILSDTRRQSAQRDATTADPKQRHATTPPTTTAWA